MAAEMATSNDIFVNLTTLETPPNGERLTLHIATTTRNHISVVIDTDTSRGRPVWQSPYTSRMATQPQPHGEAPAAVDGERRGQGSAKPARRGRPRDFDRDAALEQAMRVFWQYGFDGTSIALLTQSLGINPPSLYAAFGDKRTLYEEAIERFRTTQGAMLFRALVEETETRTAIARLLHDLADGYTHPDNPPGCMVISSATSIGPGYPDLQAALREIRVDMRHVIEKKLREGVQTGQLPPETNTHALALFLSATIQGMSTQARDGATRADLRQIAESALQAWRTTT
jgi:AcrR family transcriptional regulator